VGKGWRAQKDAHGGEAQRMGVDCGWESRGREAGSFLLLSFAGMVQPPAPTSVKKRHSSQ